MTSTAGVELRTQPTQRLHTLTVLRFAAALFVVLHHSIGPDRPAGIRLGYLGVSFFFVLSGFVLAWSYRPGMRWRDFWRNRAARIVPLYWVMIAAGAVLPMALRVSPLSVTAAFALVQAWFPDGNVRYGVHSAAWSLSTEAFFYAVFPIFFVAVARWARRAGVAAACAGGAWVVFVAVGWAVTGRLSPYDYWFTYAFPPYRFGEFAVGVLLARAWRLGWRPPAPRWLLLALAVACLGAVAATDWHEGGMPRWQAEVSATAGIALLLLWAVGSEVGGVRPWWATSALVRLGEWSYALYLVHPLVIRVVADLWGLPEAGNMPLAPAVVVVLASVPLSGLLCEGIEKPLERRLRSPRGQGTQPVMITQA
ncbi:acyltransferase family protein [Enterococcus hirae]|uniref:acyltransferase family protein n=1 Tax=Enterococcus hirae TaxID=1354 RepID=UPI001369BCE3|nr:acyltransferase [Enterococcus hirae]NAE18068.1 acyltransferase family protein [Enterococcus hirae]